LVEVVHPNETQMVELAQEALKYAAGMTPNATATASGDTVEFAGLNFGYYLVDSTLGALCALNTHNEVFYFEEKNTVPGIEKEVGSGSVTIGQAVYYTITVTVGSGAENYTVHDKMSEGLDFVQIDSVEIDDGGVLTTVPTTGYTIKTAITDGYGNPSDDCTFEIAFDNEYIKTLNASEKIVIKYHAILNENAKVKGDGTNPNEAHLEYGDENDLTATDPVKAEVTTYKFEFVKTKETTGEDKYPILDGAEFKLYTHPTGGVEIKVVKEAEGIYRVATEGETGVVITTKDGKATIKGLSAGTYYLEETNAPDGYNELSGREVVVIGDANKTLVGVIDSDIYTKDDADTHIINKTGAVLPETGGFGTTMFILIGGGLMLCTGILLVTKKRMEKIAD